MGPGGPGPGGHGPGGPGVGPGGPGVGPGGPGPGAPQARFQPYTPRGAFDRGNDRVGGPWDAPRGFSTPDHGAPPWPRPRGFGWNDGPPPGAPPPNWFGPPPPGGWNGPPPPGGWNGPWHGPPRDIALARGDFGPFNYYGYTAIPVFNPVFGGWGFWYFGVWIPLY
ncbi:MAP_0585 family protein [Mycobacterium sp. E2479]|uniref:MAP_0585 family protein n=1 Tax=Mycobacterium sp. E2479 TaxID=1834134 RepID=UPI00351121C6